VVLRRALDCVRQRLRRGHPEVGRVAAPGGECRGPLG
jgi:hypothetical protein